MPMVMVYPKTMRKQQNGIKEQLNKEMRMHRMS